MNKSAAEIFSLYPSLYRRQATSAERGVLHMAKIVRASHSPLSRPHAWLAGALAALRCTTVVDVHLLPQDESLFGKSVVLVTC